MPFAHGSRANFRLHNGSTLTDLSTYITSVGWSPEQETAETSTLGVTSKTYIPGLRDATISIEGKFDPAADAVIEAAWGNLRAFQYQPAGPGTGNVQFSGSVILTSYEVSADMGDAGSFSAEFQVTGAYTRTVL